MNIKDCFFDPCTIKKYAEEITVLDNRIEEVLYDPLNAPRELGITANLYLLEHFKEEIEPKTLESFSYQIKDEKTLFEDKIVIDYRTDNIILNQFKMEIKEPGEVFSVNYLLESKKKKYKFFDKAIGSYPKPPLPKGAEIELPYGIGVSPDDDRHVLYFLHKDLRGVCEFFNTSLLWLEGFTELVDQDLNAYKLFAISFNSKTLVPMTLKRYIYPSDVFLRSVVYDEILGGRNKN